jgi:hypothetical protein
MEKTLYATYDSPNRANQAFVELLQRGVSFMDVLLITQRTYVDPEFPSEDGRLNFPPHDLLDSNSLESAFESPNFPPEEDIPTRGDPFGDTPGGVWLLDTVRYPGDLTSCLKELGFDHQVARDVETVVLEGGAVLIMRVPSGPVDDIQGWQSMERHGGTIMAPRRGNPYLG